MGNYIVSKYSLKRANGTHIRYATKVTCPDNVVICFTELIPSKREAIKQAEYQRGKIKSEPIQPAKYSTQDAIDTATHMLEEASTQAARWEEYKANTDINNSLYLHQRWSATYQRWTQYNLELSKLCRVLDLDREAIIKQAQAK